MARGVLDFGMKNLLAMIHNLNFESVALAPAETNPVWIVDSNTMLASAVSS
jgi:hypothetical protein